MIKAKTTLAAITIVISSGVGGWIAQHSGGVSAAGPVPAGFVALNPGRIYDSRGPTGNGPRLGDGAQVTVNGGQPGASAVGVNITLTDTTAPGFVSAWPSGRLPATSVINADSANETIANFLIVPVAPDGTFQLYTQKSTHIIVDILGYMAGGSALVPAGFSGEITGYGPLTTITEVSGTVTNGTSAEINVRADVRCPNGTVKTDTTFFIPAGATRGWSVLCDGAFTSGATVTFVEI